jgi:hypothetical protein
MSWLGKEWQEWPKECPHCRLCDGVGWSEFEVGYTEWRYVDRQKGIITEIKKEDVRILCTRCKEEILEDDV